MIGIISGAVQCFGFKRKTGATVGAGTHTEIHLQFIRAAAFFLRITWLTRKIDV